MYKNIIEEIERIQRGRISGIKIASNGNTQIIGPPKGCAGLYFIYTYYTINELINCGVPPSLAAVPIAAISKELWRLNKIHPADNNGLWLIYNGVGKYNGSTYDLRARILQEISSINLKTGSLCIRQTTINDLSKWKYSYVILPTSKIQSKAKPDVNAPWFSETEALNLERYWRLHYGWPLLSRQ